MKHLFAILILLCWILPVQAAYYLTGSMNNWRQADSNYRFNTDGVLQLTLNRGNYTCKVNQGDWDWSLDASHLDYGCTDSRVLGLPDDHDNICFCISRSTTVTFRLQEGATALCIEGNFAANTWDGAINYQIENPGEPNPDAFSGTLPVLFITTEGGAAIMSKEEYVSATGYIDNLNLEAYDALGSDSAQLALSIKGRGNWTWRGFAKKPYNIKFDSKQSVLGMPKHKHWSLMAGADDNLGFLRNPVGYYISQKLGMKWTPSYRPIELVLNGEYQGLYFLTESIKIDKNRVNITSQEDGTESADSITGGWLVEIDNYYEEGNVTITEGNGATIWFTMKSPEELSGAQRTYITNQLKTLNNAIYESTSSHWEQLLNLDEAVRFYLVQEITDNTESYHGSCYLHKNNDASGDSQWYFGPVWDFGNSFYNKGNDFIYNHYPYDPMVWVGQLNSFPAFHNRLMELWYDFYHNIYPSLQTDIQAMGNEYAQAAITDANRWNGVPAPSGGNSTQTTRNMAEAIQKYWDNINWRINWLYSQWGEGTQSGVETVEKATSARKQLINGQLFILKNNHVYTATGVCIE